MPKRRDIEVTSWYQGIGPEICPLCDREIPQSQRDEHHLVPKSRGGRITQFLHRICHKQIHALFTEKELEREYSTVDALLRHPEMQKFVAWVKKKPPDFSDGTKMSRRIREGR